MTLLVCSIILVVATSISTILAKQLYFSKVSRQSELAYYAADAALMCATAIDDQYVDDSGKGIFPYNSLSTSPLTDMQTVLNSSNVRRSYRNLPSLQLSDIVCATAAIFTDTSHFEVLPEPFVRTLSDGTTESGLSSSYDMYMDLNDGTYRCAHVIVNKTATYRQIIASGYAGCSGSAYSIERALISSTEIN